MAKGASRTCPSRRLGFVPGGSAGLDSPDARLPPKADGPGSERREALTRTGEISYDPLLRVFVRRQGGGRDASDQDDGFRVRSSADGKRYCVKWRVCSS